MKSVSASGGVYHIADLYRLLRKLLPLVEGNASVSAHCQDNEFATLLCHLFVERFVGRRRGYEGNVWTHLQGCHVDVVLFVHEIVGEALRLFLPFL